MGTIKILGFDEDGNAQRLKIRIARFLDYDPVTDSDKSNIRSTLGITSQGGLGDLLAANNLDDVASLDTTKANLEIPDVGTAPNQVPTMGMLGTMSVQDADSVSVAELEVESATGTATTQALTVTDGSSTKFVVQEDGKVGVGGTPNYALDVSAGSVSLDSDWPLYFGSTNAFIEGGTSGTKLRLNHSAGLNITNAGTNHLAIDSSGRVGIGTASPGSLIEAAGASPVVEINATSGSPELQFSDGGTDEYSIMYDTGSGSLKFIEGGVGTRWSINSTGNLVAGANLGIDFGSVAGGTGTPDTTTGGLLDDFETGSFSPTFTTTGTGFTTVTVNYTNARYTKVGNCVTFSIFLKTSEIDATGATGNLCISGLPFTARSDLGNYSGAVNVGYAHLWANAPEGGYVGAGATRIQLTKRVTSITGSLSECVPTDMSLGINTNWNQIMVSGHYYTA